MTAPILVTGGTGQLARALHAAAPAAVRVAGRPDFDFDRPGSFAALFRDRPRLLVNAAAWTAVDAAEANAEAAYRANAEGPGRLAALCAEHGVKMIHISTDYVFGGAGTGPHRESDPVAPESVYGASKLAGEEAVLAALPDAVILRTAWVYARDGKNFVRTMLNAARKAPVLRVVADQTGCPTNADDLAEAVLRAARAMLDGNPARGVFHAAGAGETTWHGFAEAIFAEAARHGWPHPTVTPIATADWPTPAKRPADSRLDCSKFAASFGAALPPWRTSLQRTVAAICQAESAAA